MKSELGAVCTSEVDSDSRTQDDSELTVNALIP